AMTAAIVVAMRGNDGEKMPRIAALQQSFENACGAVCGIRVAGVQPTNLAISTVIAEDLVRAELLALPLTLFALFFVFRGFVPALLPVFIAALSTLLSMASLSLMSRVIDVSIFAANIVTLLAMGLAIDSSLFLVTRYREERRRHALFEALTRTRRTTGRAVLFSGVVVAASLAGLFAFPQVLITSIGLAGLLTAAVTTALAVTLTPALLVLFDRFLGIDDSSADALETDDDAVREAAITSSFLYRLAHKVMEKPAAVAGAVIVGLLIMAAPFKDFVGSIPDWRMLPADHPTRVACQTLDDHFTKNLMTPHEVVVQLDAPVFNDDDNERVTLLANISDALAAHPGSGVVLSPLTLARELNATAMAARLAEPRVRENPDLRRALNAFVDGDAWRFTIYPTWPAADPRSRAAVVDYVRVVKEAAAKAGGEKLVVDVRVGGIAAVVDALESRVVERVPLMILVVVIAMGIVLGAAFRSAVVPLKAIVLNALSLTASYGAVVFVFQDGFGEALLGFQSTGTSELLLPVLLFALCFGLSMDYEVILLARVREEVQRGHSDGEAVARGLALTGKSIGSAALLFCIVVGAFATSRVLSMKALGVGLALAVFIDATVVRGLLAPAAMVLLGKRNWWPSDPAQEYRDAVAAEAARLAAEAEARAAANAATTSTPPSAAT
ncbi:MAG TPA: MMPL family transporter, partial [Myxococcota bacterium]